MRGSTISSSGTSSAIEVRFLVVDALDENAADSYRQHGFSRVPGERKRLFIPFATLKELLAG